MGSCAQVGEDFLVGEGGGLGFKNLELNMGEDVRSLSEGSGLKGGENLHGFCWR